MSNNNSESESESAFLTVLEFSHNTGILEANVRSAIRHGRILADRHPVPGAPKQLRYVIPLSEMVRVNQAKAALFISKQGSRPSPVPADTLQKLYEESSSRLDFAKRLSAIVLEIQGGPSFDRSPIGSVQALRWLNEHNIPTRSKKQSLIHLPSRQKLSQVLLQSPKLGHLTEIICDNCGKTFVTYASKRPRPLKFCNRICMAEYQSSKTLYEVDKETRTGRPR